jgi:hypothetical protein
MTTMNLLKPEKTKDLRKYGEYRYIKKYDMLAITMPGVGSGSVISVPYDMDQDVLVQFSANTVSADMLNKLDEFPVYQVYIRNYMKKHGEEILKKYDLMPEFTTLDNEVTLDNAVTPDVSSDEDLAELKFKEQLNLNAILGIGLGEKEEAKA